VLIRTQVGIVGAGPAGLMLAHLLHVAGIDCVVMEQRSKDYCEKRIRAGVLEQGTVDLLKRLGLAERLQREGLVHRGIELGFSGERHHIDFEQLTGKSVTVYGQHEVVVDLIAGATARGISVVFDVHDLEVSGFEEGGKPTVAYTHGGCSYTLRCDFIAGCDGFHGICRDALPRTALSIFEKIYPYAWLGILAQSAPTRDELIYSNSERGFALFSMRSPTLTRLYLQCAPEEDIKEWSDDRIWDELSQRFKFRDGWQPGRGPVLQKGVTQMRSFVAEPMQFGRMFLAGDAAHIVPPTGAKGMNLAMADVKVLAECLRIHYYNGRREVLEQYSSICLKRVWQAQRFSWWMTSLLHRAPNASAFDHRRQLAELEYIAGSSAASTALAENYVGLPITLPA
jgi:p-hydroxybenzoate 3-monooxygenase